jgi:hypothetical protein
MFVPDSTILVAAHKYTGSQEIMTRIRYAYELCPDHIRAGCTSYNKLSLDFENGSRIVSATTTENTGRGMSISLLYADEFAFVRPGIAKEFWTSISPTLATGGKCIITSTPNSDDDQFALLWKGANKCEDEFGNPTEVGQNGFKAYRSYWQEHPDRDQAWADSQRSQLGSDRFRREMECEFIIADSTSNTNIHSYITGGPHLSNPMAVKNRTDRTSFGAMQLETDSAYKFAIYHIMRNANHSDAKVTVFIDFNNNQVYDIPQERVFSGVAGVSTYYLFGYVRTPLFPAINTATGLRVVLNNDLGSSAASDNGVGLYESGETEDYLVTFKYKQL